jgi:hypothetical protein
MNAIKIIIITLSLTTTLLHPALALEACRHNLTTPLIISNESNSSLKFMVIVPTLSGRGTATISSCDNGNSATLKSPKDTKQETVLICEIAPHTETTIQLSGNQSPENQTIINQTIDNPSNVNFCINYEFIS